MGGTRASAATQRSVVGSKAPITSGMCSVREHGGDEADVVATAAVFVGRELGSWHDECLDHLAQRGCGGRFDAEQPLGSAHGDVGGPPVEDRRDDAVFEPKW